MKHLSELLVKSRQLCPTVAVACAEEDHVLKAILEARKLNIANFLLFGQASLIISLMDEMHFKHTEGIRIIHTDSAEEAVKRAVKAVVTNEASLLMKGKVDTALLMKEVLNKEHGLVNNGLLSHTMVIQLPKFDRLLFLSDGAMSIEPTATQLTHITNNAIYVAHRLGVAYPKVAILSAIEKVNPKMKSSVVAHETASHTYDEALVYGPIALDAALDLEAAQIKNIQSGVAGHADVLITTTIEVANVLYKGWLFGVENASSAGVIVGAKMPIILTSRSDSDQTKLYSIALAAVLERK